MLLRVCLWIGGLALLCAVFVHLRKNRRVGGGVVLAAVMLSLQAVIQPSAGQMIAKRFEEDAEGEETEESGEPSLETQILRHGRRIRFGEAEESLTLRLPARETRGGR